MIYNFKEQDIIETYEYLHTIPEIEFQEQKTCAFITDFLKNIGLSPVSCLETGVYADIKGEKDNGKLLLIRADIDALPVTELTDVPYKSKHEGVMHACGHDVHMTTLLYAAKVLAENKDMFSGTVRVLFQPAEEGEGGAEPMIQKGAAEGVTAAVAMHIEPLEKTGTIVYRHGSITACPDRFAIVVKGKGGHGAEPEKCINPLLIASKVITELSQLKERYFSDRECLLSVCTCHGGTSDNIIPDFAEITGTVRAIDNETRYMLRDKIKETVDKVCVTCGAEAEFTYYALYPPTVNDSGMNNLVIEAANKTDGIALIKELEKCLMIGDDFAYFAEKAPSSYFKFGVDGKYPLHNAKMLPDKKALMIGCRLFVNIAREYLK